jgi:hypothetical protein
LNIISIAISIFLFSFNAYGSGIEKIWFSPFGTEKAADRKEPGTRILGLERGCYPERQSFRIPDDLKVKVCLQGPDGSFKEAKIEDKNGRTALFFNTTLKGIYNIVLLLERVKGNIRDVRVIKEEVNGLYPEKELEALEGKVLLKPRLTADVPFELIRERTDQETDRLETFRSGDLVTFRAYFNGKPQKDVPITLTTREGWHKILITKEDGAATFQLVRDNYKDELDEHYPREFLAEATLSVPEEGEFPGQKFTHTKYHLTWRFDHKPSELAYKSGLRFFYGFNLVLLLLVSGIFIYRLLTRRRYREERFNEWA